MKYVLLIAAVITIAFTSALSIPGSPFLINGMTQATILGVATLTYLPYCFFNLISPLMSITMAAIGFKIKQHHEEDQSIIVN